MQNLKEYKMPIIIIENIFNVYNQPQPSQLGFKGISTCYTRRPETKQSRNKQKMNQEERIMKTSHKEARRKQNKTRTT